MKIFGLGLDLVETARIARSLEKFGDRFLQRVFCEGEIAYCQSMKNPYPHFAARWAAKEAVSKTFGTGIGKAVGWKEIEVCRKESGEPYCVLHGGAKELAAKMGVRGVLISLSHTEHYAAANAVLVGE
jgi:holo-[acyl-carrier protein] synthase